MPQTKSTKVSKTSAVKEILEEGMAKLSKGEKTITVEASHALTVLSKQGWDIEDINLDLEAACVLCDNYDINYSTPPTKANVMEAITKRF